MRWMVRSGLTRIVVSAAALLSVSVASVPTALARSPLPFFRGVERLALYCGRPAKAELREKLCAIAQTSLEDLTGMEVVIGTGALGDTSAITVLVNGYAIEGPNGPVLAIEIGMLRKGHVDDRLFGTGPVLAGVDDMDAGPLEFAGKLKARLSEVVVVPWRGTAPATPTRQTGKDG